MDERVTAFLDLGSAMGLQRFGTAQHFVNRTTAHRGLVERRGRVGLN